MPRRSRHASSGELINVSASLSMRVLLPVQLSASDALSPTVLIQYPCPTRPR